MADIRNILDQVKKEHLTEKNLNSKVLIIDGLNAYLRAFSVNPTMNADGTHIGGITGFLNTITLAIRQMNPTRCFIVFDGRGGSLRRRKIYKEYKMNRHGLRVRLNRTYDFKDYEEEHDEATKQLMRLSDYLEYLPVTIMIYDNIEADDVIGYLAKKVFKEEVVIMSTDGDFVQLVDDRISIWNPPRKKLYTPQLVKDDYDFYPQNYIYYRLISGDASDGIPGINGVGIKTTLKKLPKLAEDIEISMDEFLRYIEFIPNDGEAVNKLVKGTKILKRNYTLMKLGEIEIDGSTKSQIRELIDSPVNITNITKLREIFLADKLYSAIPNFDSWLKLNFNTLNAFAISNQEKISEQKDLR